MNSTTVTADMRLHLALCCLHHLIHLRHDPEHRVQARAYIHAWVSEIKRLRHIMRLTEANYG